MVIVLLLFVALTAVLASPAPPHNWVDKRPPATTSSQGPPKAWARTVSGKFELVTPTVIDGITFSASPKSSYKTPPPWVSLNKDGRPKTIKPKIKNGETKNNWPDYDTYFDTPYTVTYDLSTLVEDHEGDRFHKEVKYEHSEEHDRDRYLNPLIRCTPDRYFNKHGGKKNSDPFCTPVQNSNILLDKVHWVTWYSREFDEAEQVRLHLAYVGQHKGHGPRHKRTDASELKGGVDYAFWSSPYMDNSGYYPLEIDESWLNNQYEQLAILAIQPESVDDSEFDLSNGTIIKLRRGHTVQKDKAKIMTSDDEGIIMAVLTVPTVIVVFACIYLYVVYASKNTRAISVNKGKLRRKFGHKYQGIPT
uniref:ARAD1A10428p n=1 Tax=Blastobotrys adeninivorans TaxID=409370 RepID=A0A060SY87_BLAAD